MTFRPKHPIKVHVWAGISMRGRTGICIFEGIMDAYMYIDILDKTLLPFLTEVYPDGHRFVHDNDPKHKSGVTTKFIENKHINWFPTPPESPDLNPIENLWHELKEYIRREIKPHSKEDLISGIKQFWETVDDEKCRKYIRHLQKVVPKVIELKGAPTGY